MKCFEISSSIKKFNAIHVRLSWQYSIVVSAPSSVALNSRPSRPVGPGSKNTSGFLRSQPVLMDTGVRKLMEIVWPNLRAKSSSNQGKGNGWNGSRYRTDNYIHVISGHTCGFSESCRICCSSIKLSLYNYRLTTAHCQVNKRRRRKLQVTHSASHNDFKHATAPSSSHFDAVVPSLCCSVSG